MELITRSYVSLYMKIHLKLVKNNEIDIKVNGSLDFAFSILTFKYVSIIWK